MKNLFKFGFAASLMAAFMFSGCSKDDDESGVDYSKKRELSESMVSKDADGSTWTSKIEYKYDNQGNVIETKSTTVDNSGKTTERKFEVKRNEQGDVTEQLLNGQLTLKTDYTYDGNTVKSISHIYTDGIETSTTYYVEEYTDSQRKQIKSFTSEVKSVDGTTISGSKVTYSYDKDGNLIDYESFDENGKLKLKIEYNGNVEKSTQYDYADGSVVSTTQAKIVYTDSNREKILTYESTNELRYNEKRKIECTYDKNGNMIGSVEYVNGSISEKSTEYVYDGNTLTYITYNYGFYNGDGFTPTEEPTSTTYHTIVYAD